MAMADNSTQQSNNCAYCLKPVVDNFICADCMKEKNVSVERLGVPPEEVVSRHAAGQIASSPKDEEKRHTDELTSRTAETQAHVARTTPANNRIDATLTAKGAANEWKKTELHSDFRKINSRSNLVTFAMFGPVAIVGFGITTIFGFPFPLAGIIGFGLAVGWIIFRSEQKAWYRYASWVFTSGQSLECDLDVVSSGELDQPYIVLKNDNRLSHAYETKIFKVIVGDTEDLFAERNAPGTKSSFRALAHFERKPQEHAIIFELADTRLWCKPHLSRGF
jgi:hypothetical protein